MGKMKGMIFAAGLGTRLKPLTDRMPKALVPVCGRPLLAWQVDKLVAAGVSDLTVNVHHFAGQVESFLAAYPVEGVTYHVSDERACLLETGGALKRATPLLAADESPVLVHNADILSNADLVDLYRAGGGTNALLLVSPRRTNRYLLFDERMRLVGWLNEQTGEVRSPYPDLSVASCRKYAFSGIHTVSPGLLRLMTDWPDRFSVMDFYLTVCRDYPIYGKLDENLRLLDVGKQESLAMADEFLKTLLPVGSSPL